MSNDQQYPYGQNQGRGQNQGQGQGQQPGTGQYGPPHAPYDPQATGAPEQAQVPPGWAGTQGQGHGYGDGQAEAAQTWEGQTWDTSYQPLVQNQHPRHPEAEYQPRHAQQARHAAAPAAPAGPGVPGFQGAPGFPGAPGVPGAGVAAAETAYMPPQTPQQAPGGPGGPMGQYGQAYGQAPASPAPGAPLTGPGSAGYSAPTTLGNARITDAQRARAEGRSPIIPPGMQPAGLTALLGLLLAGGAAVGPYALLVPLVLLQAVTAAGWFRLNGMWPARQGIALAFLGGLVSDAALLVAGKDNAPAAIIGTLGVWVLLVVVLQLRSRADADERMQGLMAAVASAALAILATGHLAALPDAVIVGGVAVAAATVARALPLPAIASVVVALLVAAGAGFVAGGFTDLGSGGALLGLGAGVCALVGLRAASYDYPSRFVHMTAGVALPLTAAAPAVYLLGRVLI